MDHILIRIHVWGCAFPARFSFWKELNWICGGLESRRGTSGSCSYSSEPDSAWGMWKACAHLCSAQSCSDSPSKARSLGCLALMTGLPFKERFYILALGKNARSKRLRIMCYIQMSHFKILRKNYGEDLDKIRKVTLSNVVGRKFPNISNGQGLDFL